MVKKISVGISVVLVICLFAVGIYIDKSRRYIETPTQTDKSFAVELVPFKEEQYLVNSVILEWMNGEYSAEQLYNSYKSKFGRFDTPSPVIINFLIENIADGDSVSSIIVEVSEYENFENAKQYKLKSHERDVEVYNLKVGWKYYYRVTVTTAIGEQANANGSFSTAITPRFIAVDGIRNVRDIGGCKTVEGKTIKQGLLFRGTELRGIMNPDFNITETGIDVLVNDLGIRKELDLRHSSEGGETISSDIEQKYYKFNFVYSEIFSEKAKGSIRNLFSDFASEKTYPSYLHCTYGSDRTGTICYLLLALLGVSEEDCYRNWELTTFFSGGSFKKEALQFMEDMKKLEGKTLQEKTENFLLSTGVTQKEIENIKKIFLE